MRKSLGSPDYARLVALLVAARKKAGLTQAELAGRLGRPQSFVAKYEAGERRIDVAEFVTIAAAMRADAAGLFRAYLAGSSATKARKSR